ncbi:MAG: glycoside hydrolase family 88 protein [Pyrinomonadaceae bacterium]
MGKNKVTHYQAALFMRFFLFIICLVLLLSAARLPVRGQTRPLSERMAATVMKVWKESSEPDADKPLKWSYEQGVVLKGMEGVWLSTGDGKYFRYIQRMMDQFVTTDGTIRTYKLDDYNIDNVLPGRNLLLLYKVTGQEKYRKAVALLCEQLKNQPRTSDGGFWHKKIYPFQMWLDGLYMGEPFYAEYATIFHEDSAYDDIVRQFVLMEQHARDSRTGLLYHGWDESRKQKWADPSTGRSPNFWGRAMGWYAMALVDTLDHIPAEHPRRRELIAIFERLAAAVKKYQEPKSGLWYQVLDKSTEKGNYRESSAACMFVYALAKGVRKGYLPSAYLKVAENGYKGILRQFIADANGQINLTGTVSVAGLGGNPYRDGSYQYYLSERVVTNDAKGVGAFLLASNEIEIAPQQTVGRGKTVVLDSYFNNETRKDATGQLAPYHYKWEEMPNSGFYFWGNVFRSFGASTKSLGEAPNPENLRRADIYIIVDPDTKEETDKPNFIEPQHIKAIVDWVKAGGVLVLMGNDLGNAEFDHFNQLAEKFGIQFKKNSLNRVQGNEFATGKIMVPTPNPIFKTAKQLFLKEISTLSITPPARAVLENGDETIVAASEFGKGRVFAVGDPWLYNEYVDGRRLPAEFENNKAARDLALWLLR